MEKHPKRPRDPSQLAKMMIDLATGDASESAAKEKDPAAVKRGRSGGEARSKSLSPQVRTSVARKAARSRWKKA